MSPVVGLLYTTHGREVVNLPALAHRDQISESAYRQARPGATHSPAIRAVLPPYAPGAVVSRFGR